MILRNAFRRKGRTTMTIAAVAISMALLVSMLSIAEGLLYNAQQSIKESKRDIIITAEGAYGITNGHDFIDSLKEDTENISAASALLGTDFTGLLGIDITDPSTSKTEKYAALGIGIVPDDEMHFLGDEGERAFQDILEVKFDKWFNEGGDPHYENDYTGKWTDEVLIDDNFAKTHKLSEGSSLVINDHTFNITGTFSTILLGEGAIDINFGIVIMHLSELQSLLNLQGSDAISSVSISLTEGHKDVESSRAIAKAIKNQHPFYTVMTKEDRLDSIEDQLVLARLFYTSIGSVSMLIGLLFVACIMIMSITERTNEFGMLRAIGISKKTIFVQILLESMVFVIIGAVIGLIAGYFGSNALGDYLKTASGLNRDFTAYTPQLLIQSLLLIISFGTVISLYPAWKAAKKKVLDALRFIR
ncbi:MAG: ABC transporter permease [Thermoplasmata archaeon]|nr:MAG: ABC transporter permease [Thermoplasmata archaeon]